MDIVFLICLILNVLNLYNARNNNRSNPSNNRKPRNINYNHRLNNIKSIKEKEKMNIQEGIQRQIIKVQEEIDKIILKETGSKKIVDLVSCKNYLQKAKNYAKKIK